MGLDAIQELLARNISRAAWAADNEERGEKVARFRRYVDGEHDAQMTKEMLELLRVKSTDGGAPFTSNKTDDVIQTMADRLKVERIEGDNDDATEWAATLLDENRFDGLQMDVHDATLTDGDSYILEEWDEEADMSRFCHELAWDGTTGMTVVYASSNKTDLAAAIKVWTETEQEFADTTRVNIYYPDRVEKFIAKAGLSYTRFVDPRMPEVWPLPWVDASGQPLGVPVVPFKNRPRAKGDFGKSELENVLPLQDGLNRTLHSTVVSTELTAFAIYVSIGFTPKAGMTPGMIVTIANKGGSPLTKEQVADFKKIEGSSLSQFIEVARYWEEQIESVSRTPNLSLNANLSGEAMKQSEIKLIGKVERFQVKGGNSWEDVLMLAHKMQTVFGSKKPPAFKRWRCVWKDAQIRNDKETVETALKVEPKIGLEAFLRIIAPVYEWDEEDIQNILDSRAKEDAARAAQQINNFNQIRAGTEQRVVALPNGTQPQQPPVIPALTS